MWNIERTKEIIADMEDTLAKAEHELQLDPKSFFYRINRQNTIDFLEELHTKLADAIAHQASQKEKLQKAS